MDFISKKSEEIKNAMIEKYDEADFVVSEGLIREELYARCLHAATAFFILNESEKFSSDFLSNLDSTLRCFLAKPKIIKKLSPEQKLAEVLKIRVTEALMEHDRILL